MAQATSLAGRILRSFVQGGKHQMAAKAGGKPEKPINLYFWPTPNGWKVSIMLEECRLPYNVIPVNIARGEQFTDAFLKVSPNNRMPAIVDHDGPGGRPISVFESGAILQYLGRKTGLFYPADERARGEVEEGLSWQGGGGGGGVFWGGGGAGGGGRTPPPPPPIPPRQRPPHPATPPTAPSATATR